MRLQAAVTVPCPLVSSVPSLPLGQHWCRFCAMCRRERLLPAATSIAFWWWVCALAFVAAMLAQPFALRAQSHEHGAQAPMRDARLELMLGGPHLILYHRGYLGIGDAQVAGLQRLQRAVCEAELTYVEQAQHWRARLADLLGDSAALAPVLPVSPVSPVSPRQSTDASRQSPEAGRPSPLHNAMTGLAAAESQWLTALLHARRDALTLLTAPQRAQSLALRDHWAREAVAMIEQSTLPGQRGHPGTQLPIRVPGMVVGATTLLPYCEALHGPSLHISIPPPR